MGSWGTEHKVLNAAVMLQVTISHKERQSEKRINKNNMCKKKNVKKKNSEKINSMWQILTVTNAFVKLGSSTGE